MRHEFSLCAKCNFEQIPVKHLCLNKCESMCWQRLYKIRKTSYSCLFLVLTVCMWWKCTSYGSRISTLTLTKIMSIRWIPINVACGTWLQRVWGVMPCLRNACDRTPIKMRPTINSSQSAPRSHLEGVSLFHYRKKHAPPPPPVKAGNPKTRCLGLAC